MTPQRLEELILLHAIGALDGSELKELQHALASGGSDAVRYAAKWNEVVTLFAQGLQPLDPPAEVKQNLLHKIQEHHAVRRAMEESGSSRLEHAQGIYSVYPERMEWIKHSVPGVSFKVLSESEKRGYVTMLMKVEPGTVFPAHHHSGEEECYILNGSIIVNGKRLGAGVLHHGDEGSDHAVLTTDEGALLLLVVAREDYVPPAAV